MPHKNRIIELGLQDKALSLILGGKCNTDIIKELGVSRACFYRWKRKVGECNQADTILERSAMIRGAVRLEISQESALTELSVQMAEYTKRYEEAWKQQDEKAAYAWSQRRVDLLEKMLRVTGIYDRAANISPEPVSIKIIEVCPDCNRQSTIFENKKPET